MPAANSVKNLYDFIRECNKGTMIFSLDILDSAIMLELLIFKPQKT